MRPGDFRGERGDFIPQEAENWDPEAVWKHLRYRINEHWVDERGREFRPYTHYCVGGNTKFWGSVLYRMRREDFHEMRHADGVSPAWPIDYDTLAPYYEKAERLYQVHGQQGADFARMIGLWWGDQMTSLREFVGQKR